MITRKEIEAFLVRYGAALGNRDLDTVIASWQAPALAIEDDASRGFVDSAGIADHFNAALTGDHPVPTTPMLDGFDVFGKAVLTADVAWRAAGADIGEKRYRYTLSGNDELGYRLRGMIAMAG